MPLTEPGPSPGEAPWLSPAGIERTRWLLASHQRAFGRPLIATFTPAPSGPSPGEARQRAQELFAAATVVLAHDGSVDRPDHDPRLIYANRSALALWRRPWHEMVGMPSRLTAEPAERSSRARLLTSARALEAISGYTGIRIDSHGRRFVISRARLWTLRDRDGRDCGQAAAFSNWWWLPT
ncbi:MEKHLA domain-containing protein [Synechococcus sp. Cruz-9H2]|uniref:MEKHLA domain-containing protein n=1 Tax=unclassified Synechococcus TaxID=2626047 RepID=UPI0020CF4F6D|nr:MULTISPECIES: MEKHLA domain-containing protein [unclassified Synechococcus]MCP9821022.1 MEKHLA domain-containing protein [Synechococcus sp. Cruz-9H2]MCP9845257.1 MEKHLA domain-containing protein [Synechococcus sp. Edmonson 11F2]MCP9857222.1 MEKHLA domain-containing protein [Synechococcus sp. Cruz-9C9]MCP9864507.1 MEKHLA domain-containing protein [Synechococcus sp. Cruz-7E5]MCP9871776.1 MEKHLA domain-containing protein [Synechococcus sp. Cruz-7B9]